MLCFDNFTCEHNNNKQSYPYSKQIILTPGDMYECKHFFFTDDGGV